jgi:5-methylcytosine-specific restriction endonuclease McrA
MKPAASKQPTLKTRAHGFYSRMKGRFAAKYHATGKNAGLIRIPERPLPYSEPELLRWLESVFPFGGTRQCPYCRVPMDAFSCTLDHIEPVSRGGSIGLENMEPVCETCNRIKGGLTREEFMELWQWLMRIDPAGSADVVRRLKAGDMGMRLRFHK